MGDEWIVFFVDGPKSPVWLQAFIPTKQEPHHLFTQFILASNQLLSVLLFVWYESLEPHQFQWPQFWSWAGVTAYEEFHMFSLCLCGFGSFLQPPKQCQ